MKNNFFQKLKLPVTYFLPLKFSISFLRVMRFKISAWYYGGRCSIGKSIRLKSFAIFQGQGHVILQDNVVLGYELAGGLTLPIILQPRESHSLIQIGMRTAIMNGCEFIARTAIIIGADCRIGPHTLIYDSDFHGLAHNQRNELGKTAIICLEDNVWVGSRAIILKGVKIGKDAVIAAGSVVTKNVQAGTIVAGNPARKIGSIYPKK